MKKDILKIKLVTIDVDGCLVSYEGTPFNSSWDALGRAYGLGAIWDNRLKQHYEKNRGKNDIEWARANVADLTGRNVEEARSKLYPLPYCVGAKEFAEHSQGKFYRGLLTTSIDLVAREADRELGFDFCYCNTLQRNDGHFSGILDYDVPTWLKHKKLEEICKRFNVKLDEICHIGDNDNDLPVAEKVRMFIAMNPKTEEVKKAADYVVYNFRAAALVLGLAA